ncbi:serine/threonine-protein kinase Sgk3 isoform X2 [Orcinus orca]|uniref:Serine/threonine-protein kinase Sgk3 isoform X2 n=2 Tax=Odontoceti TaxID=9722 RepID=A0A2Y9SX39_PHYMC|nr:serine/threonine-protein kinase Sgk3 isoform X2 [Tursiops truncatus]XP_023982768.1 serine/threonine-protein kinase Sgk3 isoform X2 [Physeter catodon]XP_026983774.1 serine/threonine-protein kinase Sgk3 isoform X2 [Lagenorhynchus obliquidens]XP_030715488.1 serine/threonine-protein kinase Sgk3 isoform X2 [Globicephala melas]XP_033293460.1 serine/threonine-protein kinase Sgk3 isoform X2 [Orcinus orca]XP_059850710.1 serine/threonine-protein kinase Sgk3 isoform X2 [Delphinus delphis]XP_059983466|eukprot:XP_023982768.1 serine/threonine-protein kinase Sgk3 isoform X2 [Physeter catodon]
MDYKESCPSVSIPSSDEHREKKKRFTVYKVLVSVGRSEWFVFRRYAEFDKLYNTLRKQFPAMALKIPAKRIFGDNFDPDFIKQRRAGLNEFIQNLVRHPELYNHPDVRAFLQMDSPKHQSDPSEDEDERSTQKLHSTSQNINLGPSGNPHAKPTDFDFLKVIGKGSFGKVLLAKRKLDGKFYAVKVLQKKIVLNRKELFFHLQRERSFPEHRARFYAAEIASALGYLHSIKIVYRDLKPENILLDSVGHVVLTDFGLCKEGIAISDTTTTFCGTPEYLAPEVIRKQPYDNTVDWWCLGAVLYEMLYGLPPFYCRDVAEMYDNILHKPLSLRPGVSLTAWSILEELLEKDRQNRLGAKEDFLEIQNHPFFESLSWTDLVQKKIPPPFNPNVAGPDDIRNFDAAFTEETVPYSVCVSSDYSIVNASVLEADDAFVGFSYAPPSEDLFL